MPIGVLSSYSESFLIFATEITNNNIKLIKPI